MISHIYVNRFPRKTRQTTQRIDLCRFASHFALRRILGTSSSSLAVMPVQPPFQQHGNHGDKPRYTTKNTGPSSTRGSLAGPWGTRH
jgi:hypothetical protein